MSGVSPAVGQLIRAASQNQQVQQQINVELLAKQQDVQKQTGDAINALLSQNVQLQQQLAKGHIDIRV